MLTLAPGMSAQALITYHEKDDPYYDTPGEWKGKLAEELGLTGPINKADFEAMCAGLNPHNPEETLVQAHSKTDEKTGEVVEERRAGNDATISMSKSFSTLYAAAVIANDQELIAKLDQMEMNVYNAVIDHINDHYAASRVPDGKGGTVCEKSTHGIVAALFPHSANRNGDAQKHGHAVIMNIARSADGKLRANDPNGAGLYRDQKLIGRLAANQEMIELKKLGLAYEITDNNDLLHRIKGVSIEAMEINSSRKAEIDRKMAQWEKEGKYQELSPAARRDLANKRTKKAKKPTTQEELYRGWADNHDKVGVDSKGMIADAWAEAQMEQDKGAEKFSGTWMNETEEDRERAKTQREQEAEQVKQAEQQAEAQKNEMQPEDYFFNKHSETWGEIHELATKGEGPHQVEAAHGGFAEWKDVVDTAKRDAEQDLDRGFQEINEAAGRLENSEPISHEITPHGEEKEPGQATPSHEVQKATNESLAEIYERIAAAGQEGGELEAAKNAIKAAGEFVSRDADVFYRDRVTELAGGLARHLDPELIDRAFDEMVAKAPDHILSGAGFVSYGGDRYSTADTYISERRLVNQVNGAPKHSLDSKAVDEFLQGRLAEKMGLSEAERASIREVGTSQTGIIVTTRGIAQDTSKIDEGLQKMWSGAGYETFTIRDYVNNATESGYDNGWKKISTEHAQKGFFVSRGAQAICRIENADKMGREDLTALIDRLQQNGVVKIELCVSEATQKFGAPPATDIIRKHSEAQSFKFEGEVKGKSEELRTILEAIDKKDFASAAGAAAYTETNNSIAAAVKAYGEARDAGKSAVIVVNSPKDRFDANVAAHEQEMAKNRWKKDASGALMVHIETTPRGDDRAIASEYKVGWNIEIGGRGKGAEVLRGEISSVDPEKNTFVISGTKSDGSEFSQVINPTSERRSIKCWVHSKIEVAPGETLSFGKGVQGIPVDFYLGNDRVRSAWGDLAAAESRQKWLNEVNVALESRNRHAGHFRPKHEEKIKVGIRQNELETIIKSSTLKAIPMPAQAREELGRGIHLEVKTETISTGRIISNKPVRLHNSPYRSGIVSTPGVRVKEGSIYDPNFRPKVEGTARELSGGHYHVVTTQDGQVVVEKNGNLFLLTNEKAENIQHTYAQTSSQNITPADSVIVVADPGRGNHAGVLTAAATAAKDELQIFTEDAKQTQAELSVQRAEKKNALDLPAKFEEPQMQQEIGSTPPATAGETVEAKNERTGSAAGEGEKAPAPAEAVAGPEKADRAEGEREKGGSVPAAEPTEKHTPAERAILAGVAILHETESIFYESSALDVAVKYAPGLYDPKELSQAFASLVEKGEIVPLGNEKGSPAFSTPAMIEMERDNITRLDQLAGKFQSHTNEQEVSEFIKKWESENFTLSAGQREMVIKMQASDNGALAVQGDPGTGKTTATQVAVAFSKDVLEQRGEGNYIVGMAYTGQAAGELGEALNRPASTVDKFLNSQVAAVDPGMVEKLSKQDPNTLYVPAGQNITLLCDESSFLGANRARQVLDARDRLEAELGVSVKIAKIGDTKQRQSISAGVDFKNSLEQSSADTVSLKDINRQKDDFSRDIARDLNVDDKKQRGPAAQEAMDRMKDAGKLNEVPSKDLAAAAVKRYFALQEQPKKYTEQGVQKETKLKDVAIAVETNADRRAINDMVRSERKARGELGETRTIEILSPSNMDSVKRGLASNYEKGAVLQFVGKEKKDGKRSKQWKGIKSGAMGEVVGNDPTKGEVSVQFTDAKGKKETKTFQAHELRHVTAMFKKEEREVSVGDKIVCLQNDKGRGVENGTRLTITGFDKEGGIIAETAKGKKKSLGDYNRVDIGYASTVDKLQGASVDACIYVSRHATHNSTNVALTRGKFHNEVVTNSIENFQKGVTKIEDKADTVRKTNQLDRQAQRESAVTQQRAPQAKKISKPSEAAKNHELDTEVGQKSQKKPSDFGHGNIQQGAHQKMEKPEVKIGEIPSQGNGGSRKLRDDFDKPLVPPRVTSDDFDKGTSAEKSTSTRSPEISSPKKSQSLDLGR